MNMDAPLLHIYSAESPHGEAIIAGNHAGLLKLIEACTDALLGERSARDDDQDIEAFCNDGEGFPIEVHLHEDESEIDLYVLPYTANEYAWQHQEAVAKGSWPLHNPAHHAG